VGDDFYQNLSNSAWDFRRVVWPVVKKWVQAEDLFPVESVPGSGNDVVDLFAGVDQWVLDGVGLRGIASRVQYPKGMNAFLSFTIRSRLPPGLPTELEKRLAALEHPSEGYVSPMFTVQAYVTVPRTGELSYVCMARTKDIFEYVRENRSDLTAMTNPQDRFAQPAAGGEA
jgi:hypothetical protein